MASAGGLKIGTQQQWRSPAKWPPHQLLACLGLWVPPAPPAGAIRALPSCQASVPFLGMRSPPTPQPGCSLPSLTAAHSWACDLVWPSDVNQGQVAERRGQGGFVRAATSGPRGSSRTGSSSSVYSTFLEPRDLLSNSFNLPQIPSVNSFQT